MIIPGKKNGFDDQQLQWLTAYVCDMNASMSSANQQVQSLSKDVAGLLEAVEELKLMIKKAIK